VQFNEVFEPSASVVGVVRRRVGVALESAGRPDLVDRATLAVSELVTNAVMYARGALCVEIAADSNGIVVAVQDSSTTEPVLTHASVTAVGGRGLALVAAVSDAWGWSPVTGGKRVWCRWDN
jgi:anti-sigma regulatory factor (Ser/Thr protein kinase)